MAINFLDRKYFPPVLSGEDDGVVSSIITRTGGITFGVDVFDVNVLIDDLAPE